MPTITPGNTSSTRTDAELIGESCPACESTEAWHGCITEDDSTKFACDECGGSIVIKRAPKPKPRKRPFSFTFEIDKGRLFIDWRGEHLLAFRPGRFLSIGDNWELLSFAEAQDREEMAVEAAREADRRKAEAAAAHLITLRVIAPGRVAGSCSCGQWHPVADPDSEVMRAAGEAHKREAMAS